MISGPECCGARPSGARRPARRVRVTSVRLVSFVAAGGRRRRCTRSSRWTRRRGWSCSQSWWRTSRCRRARLIRVRRRSWARCCARSSSQSMTPACVLVHITREKRAADGRRDGSRRRLGPAGTEVATECQRGSRARDDCGGRGSPDSGCGSSSCSPTGGRASARRRRCATRSPPRWRRRATPAGTGCSPASASISTTSGSAATSSSRVTTSSSRRCASRCFTRSRRARAVSGARSPAKGLTGTGL